MINTVKRSGRMPSNLFINATDFLFRAFYKNVSVNSKRLTKLVVTFIPLVALLVGSCKTSQLPLHYANEVMPAQFRTSLFPERSINKTTEKPSNVHVARAQTIIGSNPESLMMLTQKEISYLFGQPSFQRKDADARVWQYKTSSCVVDFYFYEDAGKKGKSNVSYIDMRFKEELKPGSAARSNPISSQEKSGCLNDVVVSKIPVKTHA